jgi:Zn-dependent oligopeptidase
MQYGRNLVAAAALFLASDGAHAKQPFVRPLVPLYDAAGVTKACKEGLASAGGIFAAMKVEPGAGAIFAEWNRLEIAVEDTVYPMYLFRVAHPDRAVRDAAERCLQEDAAFSAERLQSRALFARVKAAQPADARQAKLKKDLIGAFEDNGVALPPDRRRRAKQILVKLEQLRQAFENNLREDSTRVTFAAAEMTGLPDAYLKAHEPVRDAKGNYALTLNPSSYLPFMQQASNESARKRYYIARWNQGGAANIVLLDEIVRLRKELAQLFGFPSYAHYALRRSMAERPETVFRFLADVKAAVTEVERNEIEELRAEKARDQGTPLAKTRLERWDVGFYQERVRRSRYAIDQQKLRQYFPTDKVVEFMFAVAQRLYGVRFNETRVATWHPDVRYFDVVDAKSNRFLGGIYLDLFPREGKVGDAEITIRNASRVAGRTPLTALVLTLDRQGLDHWHFEVLIHEFGHALHTLLSRIDYVRHGSVKNDFVEAPAQMFQEWARRERPLALFKDICPRCPQLTPADIKNLEAARRYGKGIEYAREWLLATFDMTLSTDPQPALELWKRLEAGTPLGHVDGTSFPSAFSALAYNGYAAGYYGYMWSLVIALDLLTPFRKNMLDPNVGTRFRNTILAQGGQLEEMQQVRKFLGRDLSSEAFFAEITGRR